MTAAGCPEEFACAEGHCRGNPTCPNSRITPERYPALFDTLRRHRPITPDDVAKAFKVPLWVISSRPRPNVVVRAWYWMRGYR
jgi:hypothetical protein